MNAGADRRDDAANLTLTEIETAINWWRAVSPAAGEEMRLCAQAAALAEPYALMIVQGHQRIAVGSLDPKAREALAAWRASLVR